MASNSVCTHSEENCMMASSQTGFSTWYMYARHSGRHLAQVNDVAMWLSVSVEHSARMMPIIFQLFLVNFVPSSFFFF